MEAQREWDHQGKRERGAMKVAGMEKLLNLSFIIPVYNSNL